MKISVLSFQKRWGMLKQEGYDLMGAAFEDYSVLGYGMAEEIYQQSFEIGAAGYPKPRHAPPRESSIL